jgi:4-hydroxymandelate oxidase
MSQAATLGRIPSDVVCLADYERHAQALLDPAVFAYVQGGAADEITLRENVQAWSDWRLRPRVLKPMHEAHSRVDVPGLQLAHPIMLAPVAYQRLLHPQGEMATALAAAAQSAGLVVSTQASVSLEVVAQAYLPDADRGPLWFQLYLQPDRMHTLALVQRAEQAGYEALVLTVDAPVSGARDRERRSGFKLPPGVEAVNLQGMPSLHPAHSQGSAGLFDGLLQHAQTWDDVRWLREHTRLPLWLKGVTHPDDAVLAQNLGVAGLVVSNHGGRVLDTVLPTAHVLGEIRQAVGPDFPLVVDGGIRRGTDVLKALALGAHAVMVGRPYLHALATAGALGVAHAIRLLRDEFDMALALTGCTCPAQVTPAVLAAR